MFLKLAVRWLTPVYRAYHATLRLNAMLPDGSLVPAAEYRFDREIFALCERDTLALGGIIGGRSFTVLVAQGRDGDWAAAALDAIGCRVIRGSSRRDGARALIEMVRTLTTSATPAAIVVDGPLGPAGVAQPGAIVCGLKSGRPVRALGVAARWRIVFPRTWSGIYLPLPFSSVLIAVDAPLASETSSLSDVKETAQELTRRLAVARSRAEHGLGHAMASLRPA